jgi:HlyD family secretion protein/adhesin transport system membrane fusion protein
MNRLFEDEQWNYYTSVVPIMVFFVVFILWASFFELDEVVKGDGKVVPSGQTKIIQHLEGGIISKILVQEGDTVKKGDTIYELSQAFFTANFNTKEVQLKSLQAKAIRIMAEVNFQEDIVFPAELSLKIPNIIANEKEIFTQDTQSNMQKIQIAKKRLKQKVLKLSELESKMDNLSLELKLANQNMKILDQMYKKRVVSKQKYLKELQLKQTLITKVSNIKNTMPIVQQEINEALATVKSTKSQIKSTLLKEYSKVQVELNIVREEITANQDRDTRKAIISPVNGTIQKLHFYTVGGIIKSGDKVAEVTPTNDSLIIEARIKTSDRALVYSNQDVKIAITAYDTSKYGLLKGKVLFVSSDSEADTRTNNTFYVVRIKANLEGFAPNLPILPGMIANVNILTGKKTIMQYIIKPLKDISRNSLTEK